MHKFGIIILTATLITASVHAEETMQQSTVPVTELTSATNAAMETTQPEQEAQTMPGQPEAAASAETAAGSASEVPTGFNPGTVARSAFTTAIADREPVDTLETIEAAEQKIYFFT
jgi:hypothetical protein